MAQNGIGCSGLKADILYMKNATHTHTLPNDDDDDDSVFSKRTVKTKLSNWKRQMNWIYKLVEVINDNNAVPQYMLSSLVSMDFLLDKSSRAFPKTEMHSKSVLRYGVVWHVIYG